MTELISIREAGRRLGVSDTAVGKAIKVGRIDPPVIRNGRKWLDWKSVEEKWHQNTDTSKRSHVGSKGGKRRAEHYKEAEQKLPTSAELANEKPDATPQQSTGGAPSYNQSRAIREAYNARLAKLEYEEKSAALVRMDAVRLEAFKAHRKIRDAILNIPDRCAPQIASMSDVTEVYAYLMREINDVLSELSADIYNPQSQNDTVH